MNQNGGSSGMYIALGILVILLCAGAFLGMMLLSEEKPKKDIEIDSDYSNNNLPVQFRCFSGQHKDEDGNCLTNMCTCENGQKTFGVHCPKQGENICSSCNDFYHLNNNSQCVKNECKCTHGEAIDSNGCEEHNADWCKSCDNGFELSWDGYCDPPCNCKHGDAFTNGSCGEMKDQGHADCEFCNAGFVLTDKDDCENICKCQNGKSYEGAECNDDPRMCKSCNEGYYLNDSNYCIPSGENGNDPDWRDKNGWNCDHYLNCTNKGKSCCLFGKQDYWTKDTPYRSTDGKAAFEVCRHSCSYITKEIPPEPTIEPSIPSEPSAPVDSENITSTYILDPHLYLGTFIKMNDSNIYSNAEMKKLEQNFASVKMKILEWWVDDKLEDRDLISSYFRVNFQIIFHWFPNNSITNLPDMTEVEKKIENLILTIVYNNYLDLLTDEAGFENYILTKFNENYFEDKNSKNMKYDEIIQYLKNEEMGKHTLFKMYKRPLSSIEISQLNEEDLNKKLFQLVNFVIFKHVKNSMNSDCENHISPIGVWIIDKDSGPAYKFKLVKWCKGNTKVVLTNIDNFGTNLTEEECKKYSDDNNYRFLKKQKGAGAPRCYFIKENKLEQEMSFSGNTVGGDPNIGIPEEDSEDTIVFNTNSSGLSVPRSCNGSPKNCITKISNYNDKIEIVST
jgi:hypothetical protein